MKNNKNLLLKIVNFYNLKNLCILHWQVFVMICPGYFFFDQVLGFLISRFYHPLNLKKRDCLTPHSFLSAECMHCACTVHPFSVLWMN